MAQAGGHTDGALCITVQPGINSRGGTPISASPGTIERRRQDGAPLVGQHEARCPTIPLNQIADHHVLRGGVRDTGLLPIGVRRETEEQQLFRDSEFGGDRVGGT
jgi:hypothetical protein